MRKFLRLLVALIMIILVLPPAVHAQQRTITGTILSDTKTPLSGVTIRVKGTRRITQTDANGNFKIQVNEGESLEVTYVGYEPQTLKPTGNTVSISMKSADGSLSEVVVTAMDIKRNPRELGYSVQKVDGKEIQETQRENFLNSLQGRVSGATVTATSGNAGASSSIVLRGFNSLSMSNQPLFVIDGVIVDNNTIDENSNGGSTVGIVERPAGLTNTANKNNDYNNRISDLNPNDIETITVLKGPEATALYGSQASSGAIIITTRKAKTSKLGIQYDNSFRVQNLTRFPETFDAYTSGSNGAPENAFRYFGPEYPEGTKLYDNKSKFFRTGFAQTHNLGVDFGITDKSIFRVSGSLFDQQGVIPYNDYKRYNVRISNTTKIGKYVELMPALSYINTENRKVLRSAGGFMLALLAWPSTNNIEASQGDNASKVPLFSANPNSDYDNPLFNVKNNKAGEKTNRYNASLGININPFSWLSVNGRFGYETYNTDGYLRYHPLSYYISVGQGGIQDNFYRKYNGYNHTITATARKTVADDFNFRLMVGTMWQDYKTEMYAVSGSGLVDSIVNGKMYKAGQALTDQTYNTLVPGVTDSNATRPATRTRLLRNVYGEYNQALLRQFAYFGEIGFNYKNVVFLSYTHRFEEASTLPVQNRKFNYPGGSISAILTDIFPVMKKGNVLNYMKVRGSIAATARLNSPYSTQSVFVNNLSSGGGFSYGFFNNNKDLEPEKQKTFEIGTEMRFMKSRLNIDATYYRTLNKDQIIENFRLSYGTGYVLNTQNAGSTRNQGVEVSIDYTMIRKQSLMWNMRFNFSRMWNKVVEMPKNVSLYYLADVNVYGNAAGGIVLGGPTTTISGFGYMRNNKGQILINPTSGLPVIDGNQRVRGDRTPDFTLGWINTITMKNWRLNFLWDLKVGGDIYNGTNQFLTTIGRSKLTADRTTPRVLDGVLQDGRENTDNPTANTIVVTPYYNDNYYRLMPEEAFIEKDVNWFRLKDVTLSYTFPQSTINRIGKIKSLSAFATFNDVILLTNYSGADPSVNANTSGTRGVGGFGFDYGTVPSQLSMNFGFRIAL
jgi:TonB-linked SusC/RagA family outer membrane protein